MIEQASLVIGEGNWAVKSDSLLGYKINNGKYYPREMSVVRATTGTRINEDGLVEVVPYNLLTDSQAFNLWATNASPTITANNLVAPDGTMTADTFATSANASGVYQVPSVANGSTYTFSVYIKNISNATSLLLGCDAFPATAFINYNAVTNSITSIGGSVLSSSVINAGNGWYRVSGTYVSQGSVNSNVVYATTTSPMQFGVWGAQLVEGSSALDYLPTTDRLDVARIDYSSGSAALLVEPQRTNYFPFSQDIANWYEPDDGVTLTSNTMDTVSPDGTNNASKITIVGGSQRSYQITNSVSGTGTFSAYVKAGTSSTLALYTSSASLLIGYNLSTLAVIQTIGTGTITSVGNGWYRITATSTLGASEVLQVLYTGNANETIYIWGFQLEAGSYATSYIPTTSGTSVTRNADQVFKTGIADLIGQTEGTLYFEIDKESLQDDSRYMFVSDASFSNRIVIYQASTGINVYCSAGATFNFVFNPPSGNLKVAVGYKSGLYTFFVNGIERATSNISAVPTGLNTTGLGVNESTLGAAAPSVSYKAAAIFKTRLTNAELATLTTI